MSLVAAALKLADYVPMRRAVFLLTLMGAACSGEPEQLMPDEALIDRLEERLASMPCVGSLERWERRYWFARLCHRARCRQDFERIKIDLRQAGFEEYSHGRQIYATGPRELWGIDDREYDLAFGHYDIASDRISLSTCGRNMDGDVGPPPKPGIAQPPARPPASSP